MIIKKIPLCSSYHNIIILCYFSFYPNPIPYPQGIVNVSGNFITWDFFEFSLVIGFIINLVPKTKKSAIRI